MKKKGFTLVELLATIVVLSVIALIATPIILNVIEKAKKGALVSSVNGLVESANMYYTNEIIKGDINEDVVFDFEEGIQTSNEKLSYKGKVYNGKLILTSDSDVITCIDDGKYYAYKEKDSDEVISGIGTCLYDGTTGDFTIESDVDVIIKECDEDKKELQEQITNLTTTVNNLQQTINEKEQAISDLTSIKEGLENQVTTLEGEKEELLKQIENSNLSNSELNTKITELEGTIDTLESSIEAKNNEITTLNGEKTELQNQLTTKTNELKTLNENLGKVTASASDVLSGKTILTSSGLVTGSMTNNGSVNKTLSINGTYTIPAGYHDGTGKVTQSITTKAAATYTPTTSNQTIASGQYLSGTQTIKGDANLVSSNIKSGTSIFGVTGTYTSDANATASQILKGKTAYVNGSKITGTMVNKAGTTTAASTVTESGDNALITIPANGYYSTSSKISVPIETIKNYIGGGIHDSSDYYYYSGKGSYTKTIRTLNDYKKLFIIGVHSTYIAGDFNLSLSSNNISTVESKTLSGWYLNSKYETYQLSNVKSNSLLNFTLSEGYTNGDNIVLFLVGTNNENASAYTYSSEISGTITQSHTIKTDCEQIDILVEQPSYKAATYSITSNNSSSIIYQEEYTTLTGWYNNTSFAIYHIINPKKGDTITISSTGGHSNGDAFVAYIVEN